MTTNNEQNTKQNTEQIAVDNLNGSMGDNGEKTVTDTPFRLVSTKTGRAYNASNLKGCNPKYNNTLTTEEAQRRGSIGGQKSGEARKARKTMKETILAMLSQEITPEQMEQYGLDKAMLNGDNTMQGAIIASMLREALNGSEKAALLLRDTINEAPVARSEVVQEVITKDDTALMDTLKQSLIS